MHHVFLLTVSAQLPDQGDHEGDRPAFVVDPHAARDDPRSSGVFSLSTDIPGEVQQYITGGLGGFSDWSLRLQLAQAVESTVRVLSQDGSWVWVVEIPRNPTVLTTSYPCLVKLLTNSMPGALPPLRAAVFACAARRAPDPAPPPPAVWDDPAFQDVPSPPATFISWLADETAAARAHIATQLRDIHVLLDDSGTGCPTVYALPNKKAVATMVRWVGHATQQGALDEASTRLFCSLLRRHDRYLPTFGDIPPELLTLEYGPSQRAPQTACLSAVYYPTDHCPSHRTPLRLDVGTDAAFSASLREPSDATADSTLRRRLHDAIREDTRVHRAQSMLTADPVCATCSVGLANLQAAQELPVDASVDGEFHHIITVAELCQRHCETVAAPEALLQRPPNHHLFRPSAARDAISADLRDPRSTAWLCPGCHAAETATCNRATALAAQLPTPPPLPPLNAWWAILQLGGQHGFLPAPPPPPCAAASDATVTSPPAPRPWWEALMPLLPPLPAAMTATTVVLALSIAAAYITAAHTSDLMPSPPPSPPDDPPALPSPPDDPPPNSALPETAEFSPSDSVALSYIRTEYEQWGEGGAFQRRSSPHAASRIHRILDSVAYVEPALDEEQDALTDGVALANAHFLRGCEYTGPVAGLVSLATWNRNQCHLQGPFSCASITSFCQCPDALHCCTREVYQADQSIFCDECFFESPDTDERGCQCDCKGCCGSDSELGEDTDSESDAAWPSAQQDAETVVIPEDGGYFAYNTSGQSVEELMRMSARVGMRAIAGGRARPADYAAVQWAAWLGPPDSEDATANIWEDPTHRDAIHARFADLLPQPASARFSDLLSRPDPGPVPSPPPSPPEASSSASPSEAEAPQPQAQPAAEPAPWPTPPFYVPSTQPPTPIYPTDYAVLVSAAYTLAACEVNGDTPNLDTRGHGRAVKDLRKAGIRLHGLTPAQAKCAAWILLYATHCRPVAGSLSRRNAFGIIRSILHDAADAEQLRFEWAIPGLSIAYEQVISAVHHWRYVEATGGQVPPALVLSDPSPPDLIRGSLDHWAPLPGAPPPSPPPSPPATPPLSPPCSPPASPSPSPASVPALSLAATDESAEESAPAPSPAPEPAPEPPSTLSSAPASSSAPESAPAPADAAATEPDLASMLFDLSAHTPGHGALPEAAALTPHTSGASLYESYVGTPRPIADLSSLDREGAIQTCAALQTYVDACLARIAEDRASQRAVLARYSITIHERVNQLHVETQRADIAEAAVAAAEASAVAAAQRVERAVEDTRALRLQAADLQAKYDESEIMREQAVLRQRATVVAHATLESDSYALGVRVEKLTAERDRLIGTSTPAHPPRAAMVVSDDTLNDALEDAQIEISRLEAEVLQLESQLTLLREALDTADADLFAAREGHSAAAATAHRAQESAALGLDPGLAQRLLRIETALSARPPTAATSLAAGTKPPARAVVTSLASGAKPPDVTLPPSDRDDTETVASAVPEVEEKLAFYASSTSAKMAAIASSTNKEIARQVLSSAEDFTGTEWRRRALMTSKVVRAWARATARRAKNGYADRGETEALRALDAFRFPAELRSSDPDAQAAAWDSTRSSMANILRDLLTSGGDFEIALLKLLSASRDPARGNKRVEGYLRESVKDPLSAIFAPLAADTFLFTLDLSYRTAKYGHDSVEADWDACTSRHPEDDCVSLAVRVVQAYITKLSAERWTIENIWEDSMHRNAINTRYADCLLNDIANAQRGEANSEYFISRWKFYEAKLEMAEATPSELSCTRIARLEVRTMEASRKSPKKESRAPQPRDSRRPLLGAAVQEPPPLHRADEPYDTAAFVEPPPHPGKGRDLGGKGGKGKAAGQPAPGRGPGRGGASAPSDGSGTAPGTAPPPSLASTHRTEPPPNRTPPGQPPPQQRRQCDPPASGAGKPAGVPTGDWTIGQWRTVLVDFNYLDELSSTTAGKATAKARPQYLDPSIVETRTGQPRPLADGTWADDACTYCAFRPPAPPGTAATDHWWYGTGKGNHNPHRCQPFKRYLAEGGDPASEPAFAGHLRRCLRLQQSSQQ